MPPIPKRRAERLGHGQYAKGVDEVDTVRMPGAVQPPSVARDLHPVARRWYRSLRRSGQARFYEPSDWALAVFVAHAMDAAIRTVPFNATGVKVVMDAAEGLLSTEAERRRARIEVERVMPGTGNDGEKPKEIRDYRTRFAITDGGASPASVDGTDGGAPA